MGGKERFSIFSLGKGGPFRIFVVVAIFKFRNLKSGQAMPLPPGEFTVGRSDQAYIHVEDASVSRRHAKVINNAEGLFVEDAGSANGTAMQGTLIVGRRQLAIGDVIHIGSVPFRIDPEVGGDNITPVAPMAGRRTANRDYMRRDTERLSLENIDKAVEALSAQTDAALAQVASETESEELEAIETRGDEPTPSEPAAKGGWFHGFSKPAIKGDPETTFAPKPVAVRATIAPEPRIATPVPAAGNGLLGFLGKNKTQAVPRIVEASPIAFEVNAPDIEVLTAICTLVVKGVLKGGVKITGSYNVQALNDLRSTRNIKLVEEADFIILS